FHIDFDPLTHGVLWSLLFNTAAYVAVSFLREPSPIERLQASAFVAPAIPAASPALRLWRTGVSVGELQDAVARYLGKERTGRAFAEFAKGSTPMEASGEADIRALRFAEHLLASAIGAASSRLVLGQLLEQRAGDRPGAISLLDDASEAIQHSRDLLQSAIDHVRQGIAVFDKDLDLICWNRQFRRLLDLPPELGRIGVALDEVLRAVAVRTGVAPRDVERVTKDRVLRLCKGSDPYQERIAGGPVLEVRSSRMPDGGIVVTFADMTERVSAAEELKAMNESLERRVAERTGELALAKADAEAANLGKTRFIAAASHDILQPLNAARLFTSSLVERHGPDNGNDNGDDRLVANLDASLEAVEEILTALLDISRLDAGATKPELGSFAIGELLQALAIEMAPAAGNRGVEITVVPSSLVVRSDRKLLRRILQNLMSNAVKYAPGGRVLIGCRRRGDALRVEVHDTGCGIPADKLQTIFVEFERLGQGSEQVPGLGLGLSIVERIARMLDSPLDVRSEPGRGSSFTLTVPLAVGRAALQAAREDAPRAGELAGATVLVIDNEKAILEGMQALLGQWRIDVVTARGGAEAGAALASRPSIGLIVADYHLEHDDLEGDDGLVVIEKLRGQAGRAIPAILITADRSAAVRERAESIGVVHMRKPVRAAPLRAALSHLVTRREAAE
ncbi:MAG TPA: NahK/ErcS family hybrid sensor histidine kinase/response regulator, partial [Aestuariivirgaceae bacterium]|nr:NahK/ErcS family hybrid sensor histidine kinase/response regulator [Aestuariivirgaceae bacterium]